MICRQNVPQIRLHTWYHMFADLDQLPINPRVMSCFGDEDFVRRLCSIVAWLKLAGYMQHQEHE